LKQKMMENVNFDVIVTDDLPVDPKTRKFRLILDAAKSGCVNLAA
jgi:phenylacetate-CoA ligase